MSDETRVHDASTMRDSRILVGGIALLIACGSSNNVTVDANPTQHDGRIDGAGSSANEVSGQVDGHAFDAKDAVWKQFNPTNGFSFVGGAAFVEMTDYAGACALDAQGVAPTTSLALIVGVAVNDASAISSVPTAAGTFAVHSSANPLPSSANVAQFYFGSGCSKDLAYEGISGTVTIVTVHPDGSYSGTFDVVVSCASFSNCAGADAHLTGQFDSAACASLDVNTIPVCS